MPERKKIFLAYCYAEKRWLDGVQAALAPNHGLASLVIWDERKIRSKVGRTELPEVLSTSSVAVMLVSDLFLKSEFITEVKLPRVLEAAQAQGLKVCWVLVSHCLYEKAGLDPAQAVNNLDWPLDGLSAQRRESVLAGVAKSIRMLAGEKPSLETPSPASRGRSRKSAGAAEEAMPEPEAVEPSPFVPRLGAVIEERVRTILRLERVTKGLTLGSIAILLLSIPVAASIGSFALFLLLAGFGIFVLALSFALHSHVECLAQSVIGIRCVRTGLADGSLPGRQRGAFMQRAQEILGET